MKQTILTFVTEVDPARVSELARILDEIAADLAGNRYILFARLKSLHFASFVLHEDADYGPRLIFENNFDGTLDVYLEEPYRNAAQGLHQTYACCLDYPASSVANHGAILAYLKEHVVRECAHDTVHHLSSSERLAHDASLDEL